jgi:hypothetical protein
MGRGSFLVQARDPKLQKIYCAIPTAFSLESMTFSISGLHASQTGAPPPETGGLLIG